MYVCQRHLVGDGARNVAARVSLPGILAGGILCVLVNWNPFAKMDGYMLFTEWFRIPDIKATSTKWLIAWIRVKVFHMPG